MTGIRTIDMSEMRSALLRVTLVSAGVLGWGCALEEVRAQDNSEQRSELTEGQAILQELQAIRKLLETNPPGGAVRAGPPQRAEVALADGHVLGSSEAPLTLVEFTDYQCPFCSRFSGTTLEELKTVYIDTGQVRLVSRDLPLAMHDNAMRAANAARCAAEQDYYWEMRATMFANTDRLDQDSLIGYANDLALDAVAFRKCLTTDKYGDEVRQDAADAGAVGITGTPSFVLGKTSGDRLEGAVIIGAQPFATFDSQIKALLSEDN